MAGIDDIGGQVMPQGEEEPTTGMFDRVMVPFIIILWENSVCLLPIYKKAMPGTYHV